MDNQIIKTLSKIIFWQRMMMVIISLCLMGIWIAFIFFSIEKNLWQNIIDTSSPSFEKRIIALLALILYLLLASYSPVLLYRSSCIFKQYTEQPAIILLKDGFKQQRYFLMCSIALVFTVPLAIGIMLLSLVVFGIN